MFRVVSILAVLGISLMIAEPTRAEGTMKAYKSKQAQNPTYVIQSSGDKARMVSSLFEAPANAPQAKTNEHCEQSNFLMRGVCKAWLSFKGPSAP